MNQLKTFMAEATLQARPLIKEPFTIVGEVSPPAEPRVGVFGDSTVIPVMTRTGYQDHAVMFARVEKVLFATPPEPRIELVRTLTGETLFVHAVENKDPVVYTFTLTDREL